MRQTALFCAAVLGAFAMAVGARAEETPNGQQLKTATVAACKALRAKISAQEGIKVVYPFGGTSPYYSPPLNQDWLNRTYARCSFYYKDAQDPLGRNKPYSGGVIAQIHWLAPCRLSGRIWVDVSRSLAWRFTCKAGAGRFTLPALHRRP